MREQARVIRGDRADLTRVRRPEKLRFVAVEGPGVASLRGIELMARLRQLTLRRTAIADLTPLGALDELELLDFEHPQVLGDLAPLRGLRHLRLDLAPEHVPALATLDFAALGRLEVLQVSAGAGARVPLAVAGIERLSALERLSLEGIVVDAEGLERIAALPRLDHVLLTPRTRAEKQAMRDRLPSRVTLLTHEHMDDVDANVIVRRPGGWELRVARPSDLEPPAIAGVQVRRQGPWWWISAAERAGVEAAQRAIDAVTPERGGRLPVRSRLGTIYDSGAGAPLSLCLDLAEVLGLETNLEAEERLRARLPAALARRLDFDSEAGEVVVLAPERADLEAVQQIIKALASRPSAPPS
jgi:hypothetical protein